MIDRAMARKWTLAKSFALSASDERFKRTENPSSLITNPESLIHESLILNR